MQPGTHRFKFIVDDEWKCSEDLPVTSDEEGHLINFITVEDENGQHQGDGLDDLGQVDNNPQGDALSLIS